MYHNSQYVPDLDVSVLMGQTIKEIVNTDGYELRFVMEDGSEYLMLHEQDCCEDVRIESIDGDLSDLIGSPLLQSEEVVGETPADWEEPEWTDSYTWTFYKFATIKGSVTIRWYGSSNGYYSERVSFARVA